ncbi:MAG: hypothetical protein QM750_18610 [Rubrivivax sp.]
MKPLLVLTLLLACGLAQAQTTVWRCGPDGRSYGDSPCADGRALALADTAVAPADAARARALAAQDRRLAQQLAAERRERDARLRGSGLAGIQPAAAVTPPEPVLQPRPPSKAKLHRTAGAGTLRKAARASRQTRG